MATRPYETILCHGNIPGHSMYISTKIQVVSHNNIDKKCHCAKQLRFSDVYIAVTLPSHMAEYNSDYDKANCNELSNVSTFR